MEKKSIKKKIIKYLIIIALFTFSFWYLFKDINFNDLSGALENMKIPFLILAFFMVFVQIFIQGLCYTAMGRGLNVKINPLKGFNYCSVDLFFSQLTPFAVGGQPVMVYEMKRKDNLPVAQTTTMALLYSFLNKLALIIMAIVALLFYFNDFFGGVSNKGLIIGLLVFGMCSNLIIASLSIVLMVMGETAYKIATRLIFWLNKHGLVKNPYDKCKKFRKTVDNFKESNKFFIKHLLLCLFVLFLCILKRFATFAVAFFIYKGFGLDAHSFIYIIAAQTIYAVISDTFPIPGGIGAAETSIKSIYDGIYSGSGLADVAALLVRFISYYFLILVSGVTTFIVMSTKGKRKEEVTNGEVQEGVSSPNEAL